MFIEQKACLAVGILLYLTAINSKTIADIKNHILAKLIPYKNHISSHSNPLKPKTAIGRMNI